jgi:large conductance mechanosensitive channel
MGMMSEFKEFLEEYKVVGVAVAFIMAAATTTLIQSLVNNIVMPLLSPLLPGGDWQTGLLLIGPFKIGWGAFLAACINFVIIALVIFMIAKMVMKEEKVAKK